ncbi:hypothetical protein HPB47_002979, partial [Ixodes persulcatus]
TPPTVQSMNYSTHRGRVCIASGEESSQTGSTVPAGLPHAHDVSRDELDWLFKTANCQSCWCHFLSLVR